MGHMKVNSKFRRGVKAEIVRLKLLFTFEVLKLSNKVFRLVINYIKNVLERGKVLLGVVHGYLPLLKVLFILKKCNISLS